MTTQEIKQLGNKRREIAGKLSILYDQDAEVATKIRKLQVEDFLRNAHLHLRLVVWGPLFVTPTRIGLDAVEISDAVDNLLHSALGLNYHDEAELEEGVVLRVDDENTKLLISTPSKLLDFASCYHLNIRWSKFREMLEKLEAATHKSASLERELRTILKDLKIPEGAP